jgi:hypothetical protein
MDICWFCTEATLTFFSVLRARLIPFSTASSKLFSDDEMIPVTLVAEVVMMGLTEKGALEISSFRGRHQGDPRKSQ